MVNTKPSGQGLDINDWEAYITNLRQLAEKFKVTVRDIEISLFFYHEKLQEGNLYSKKTQD